MLRVSEYRIRHIAATRTASAALALLLMFAGVRQVAAQPLAADQIEAIGKRAAQAALLSLDRTGAASVTVAVGDEHGAFWQGQFGLADTQTQEAPTPETVFGIGSTSKAIAATATLILADRGLVSLDEPLVTYLPEFKMATPGYEKITVRMLLDHSAGLPGSDYRNSMVRDPSVDRSYPERLLTTLAHERLAHEPGYLSTYTNDGFTLIELLVKARTGLAYRDFVRIEIFGPLGMRHSGFLDEQLPAGSYARNYRGGLALSQEYLPLDATGAVCSTAQDMARFAAMLLGKGSFEGVRILSPESVAAMGEDKNATKFNPLGEPHYMRYGLGWDTINQEGMAIAGQRAWEKGGDTSSYGCSLIVLPDAGLAAVVIGSSGINSSVASSIAEQALWKALAVSGRIESEPKSIIPAEVHKAEAPAELRAAVPGVYVSYMGVFRVDVDAEDTYNLEVLAAGEWKPLIAGLRYTDDGWFANTSGERVGSGIKYVVGDGRAYLAIRSYESNGLYFNTQVFAQKLVPAAPLPDAWKQRVGSAWVPINYSPFEEYASPTSDPRMMLTSVQGADGYVCSTNSDGTATTLPVDANRSNSFILIPQLMGRDLYDLEILPHNGYDLLRTTSTLFRPLASVPSLPARGALITIGHEGWTEWLKVPASARLSVVGGRAWALYDTSFAQAASARPDGALLNAPEGWLALYGAPGDQIRVTAVPLPPKEKAAE